MSRHCYSKSQKLNCLRCYHQFDAQIWLIVNAAQQPDLLQRLQQGSLHQVDCPNCGEVVEVDAPLLLYRPDAVPHLLFSPAQAISEKENQRIERELVEKLRDNLGVEWQDSWLEELQEISRNLLLVVLEQELEIVRKQIQEELEETNSQFIQNLININIDIEEESGEYLEILRELLQAQWNFNGDRQIIWSVIEEYRHKFDERFIFVLQQWVNQQFAKLANQTERAEILAELMEKLCLNIFGFIGGCSFNEFQVIITLYQLILPFRTETKNIKKQLAVLNNLGAAYWNLAEIDIEQKYNLQRSIDILQQAIDICQNVEFSRDLSSSLNNLGAAYYKLAEIGVEEKANLQKAIDCSQQSANIRKNSGLNEDLSSSLNTLGAAYTKLAKIGVEKKANLQKAIDFYQQSADIRQQLGLNQDLSSSLNHLGNAYKDLAKIGVEKKLNLQKAINSLHKSIELRQQIGLKKDLCSSLNALGAAYYQLAEIGVEEKANLQKAIDFYQQSADIYQRLRLNEDLSSSFNNLGAAYWKLGTIGAEGETNLQKAIVIFQQAADIRQNLGLNEDLSSSCNNLGAAYYKLAEIGVEKKTNLDKATNFFQQAANIRKQLNLNEDLSSSLNDLGVAYTDLAKIGVEKKTNLDKAIDCCQQSANIRKQLSLNKDLSSSLNNLGVAYTQLAKIGIEEKANLQKAIDCCQQSADICKQLSLNEELSLALNNLGVAYIQLAKIGVEKKTNLDKAINFFQQAANIRKQLNLTQDLSSSLNNLGVAYTDLGKIGIEEKANLQKAIDCCQQAANIRKQLSLNKDLSSSLNNLGVAYTQLAKIGIEEKANLQKAIDCCQQSADICKQLSLNEELSLALNNLGVAYIQLAKIGVEKKTNFDKAIHFFQQAANIRNQLNLNEDLSSSLNDLGAAYTELAKIGVEEKANLQKAIDCYEQAANIRKQLSLNEDLSSSLNNLGLAYQKLAEFGVERITNSQKTIECHQQAVDICQQLNCNEDLSSSLNKLGNAYRGLLQIGVGGKDNLQKAIDCHQQAVDICQKFSFNEELFSSLNNLGLTYLSLAEIGVDKKLNIQKAIDSFQKATDIYQHFSFNENLAIALNNLGNAYRELAIINTINKNNLQKAIDCFQQSADIYKHLSLNENLSSALNNLGITYLSLVETGAKEKTNLQIGIVFLQQSADICKRFEFNKSLSLTLNNLGLAYLKLANSYSVDVRNSYTCSFIKNYKQEEIIKKYIRFKSLIKLSFSIKLRITRTWKLYKSFDNLQKCIECCQKSVDICHRLGLSRDASSTLNNLGVAYEKLAEFGVQREAHFKTAIDCHRQSLQFSKPQFLPVDCRQTGSNLGDLAFRQGWWKIALEGYEAAILAIEQIRTWAKDDKQRQEILTEGIYIYERALQCYINLGEYKQAILLTERARSRHLVDLIYSNELHRDADIDPDIRAYLEQYEDIQTQINKEQSRQQRDNTNKVIPMDEKLQSRYVSFEEIKFTLKDLYKRKDEIWLKIRKEDKVLADGLEVPHLTFENLRKLIADSPKTALLSFYSTREHTYIFVLRHCQNNTVTSDETSLQSPNRISLQLHTCKNEGYGNLQTFVQEEWLNIYQEDMQTWRQPEQMEKTLQQIADKLSINNLINNHLQNIEELIIIPHIFLHLIPFAALPVNFPESSITEETSSQKYLSDLFRLRVVPSAQILAYCQEREDKNPYSFVEGEKYVTIEDATNDLIAASYECEQIVRLLGIPTTQRLIGKQNATVDNYRQLTQNPQIRGLHSSHHAEWDLDKPLESALRLGDGSLTLGQLISPGWRMPYLVEIFLSCCETNFGNPNITDDILTLAAGFLCAGARSVIGTLWSVDALATAIFCLLYYQHRQNGSDRSTALRLAQQDLRNKTVGELKEQLNNIGGYLSKLKKQTTERSKKLKIGSLRLHIAYIKDQPNDDKPFASPFYWAGFICHGL
ncbi:MAG: CHAT domain-containing protein [Rivularia sp. (in: Bacteria)]|nr:CHAT domain-containing protein [Rivularia sp. MS3]